MKLTVYSYQQYFYEINLVLYFTYFIDLTNLFYMCIYLFYIISAFE